MADVSNFANIICDVCHKMAIGWITANDGNVSVHVMRTPCHKLFNGSPVKFYHSEKLVIKYERRSDREVSVLQASKNAYSLLWRTRRCELLFTLIHQLQLDSSSACSIVDTYSLIESAICYRFEFQLLGVYFNNGSFPDTELHHTYKNTTWCCQKPWTLTVVVM